MSRSDFERSGFLFLTILVAMIVFLDQQAGGNHPDTLSLHFPDEP